MARLAVKLYLYLGLGWRWSSSALRLILYSLLLLPGFAQVLPTAWLSTSLSLVRSF